MGEMLQAATYCKMYGYDEEGWDAVTLNQYNIFYVFIYPNGYYPLEFAAVTPNFSTNDVLLNQYAQDWCLAYKFDGLG